LKELQSGGKIVQQMTRNGVVEVNKATGGAERISGRELAVSHDTNEAEPLAGVADRILSERRELKKRAVKRENTKIFKRVQRSPDSTRLQFTDEERTDPALAKSIKKSEKAAVRYEKAQARVPKEKVLSIERVPDAPTIPKGERKPEAIRPVFSDKGRLTDLQRVTGKPDGIPTGKPATRLVFRERDKPPNGKLTHALSRPGREAGLAFHGEIRKREGDNVGVEAAHGAEQTAESAGRFAAAGYRHMQFRPYKNAEKATEKAFKANVNVLYEQSLRMNPELEHMGPIKKALHKRKIQRDYAKTFRESQKTAERVKTTARTAKKAAEKTKEAVEKAGRFVVRHWKGILMFGGAFLLLVLLITGISSCVSMFGGGFTSVIGTSYTAEDEDIIGADADYTALESQLAARIAGIESTYGGYDEYRYSLDEIGHDPFELASYLTAKFNMYTREQVQAELQSLFNQQYTLTLTSVTEIRYKTETRTGSYTWTDADGNSHSESYTYEVQVPYNYYILYITLTNRSLGAIALSNLTSEQAEMYAVYMETKGNKPELFGGNPYVRGEYTHYDIPPAALTDTAFAAMMREAEKYLGMPYVWGGSSPSTSFDCSGFVCYVVNQSGVGSVGRTTAQGLFDICAIIPPSDARPGDLILFHSTYNSPGAVSHVGIYVGGGYMVHAGNPIGYADITSPYWVNHFYAFGRLP